VTEHRWQLPASDAARKLILIALAVIAIVIALYVAAVLVTGGGVRAGTTVNGVNIGGLSREEAIATLDDSVGKVAAKPLRVKAGEQQLQVDPIEAGLTFDAAATVEKASGRTLNPFTMIGSLAGTHALDPVIAVDSTKLNSQVAQLADTVDVPAIEPTVTVTRKGTKVEEGKPGLALDQPAMAEQLTNAFMLPRKPLTAAIVTAEPNISKAAVQEAVDVARTAVSAPVRVDAAGTIASIRPGAIAQALNFTAEGDRFVPSLDGAVLHQAIGRQLTGVETTGRNATFTIVKGKPVVVPSVVGNGVSDEELSSKVLTVIGNPEPDRTVAVTMGVREPELTTAQAETLGVTERISTFTQKFPYAAYRVQNIGQAAERVNGTLLLPGETFSLNDTIKERTEKNGYTVGFLIGPGGVFAEDLGGGVSASATTVWTGAFFAGMEPEEVKAHSIYISRYQAGLEATVGWGLFDMSFTNTSPYGVFITTKMTNTSMSVSFWSTKVYDEIKAEFGPRTNIKPFATIYDKSEKCLGQDGSEGFDINVDRVFYKDGVEAKRETISTAYRPAPKVICGKKPKPLPVCLEGELPKPIARPNAKPTCAPAGSSSGRPGANQSATATTPESGSPKATDAVTGDGAPTQDVATAEKQSPKASKKPGKKPSAEASAKASAKATPKPTKSAT
jgi:vancomycin resistance protein YoaR